VDLWRHVFGPFVGFQNNSPDCPTSPFVGQKLPVVRSSNGTVMSAKVSRAGRPWRSTKNLPQRPKEGYGMQWPEELAGDVHRTIAIHKGHDAHIAIAIGSRIQCVLELERFFGRRYFFPKVDHFSRDWQLAAELVRDHCDCESGSCPPEFDTGLVVDFGTYESIQATQLPKVIERVFPVKEWRNVNHHESHALMAYYSSPFRSSLILSFDGGGNDGTWNVFVGQGLDVYRISREQINLGKAYTRVASFMPALTGFDLSLQKLCSALPLNSPGFNLTWDEAMINWPLTKLEGFAGKMMGYSGIKAPSPEASEWMRQFYQRAADGDHRLPGAVLNMMCKSEEGRQLVAASTQDEFSKFVQPKVANYLLQLKLKSINVEGIVLVGGCALNVVTNQVIRETLTSFTSPMDGGSRPRDVYVPPAPNDSGLAVGAIWSLFPPTVRQPLQYLGFRLFDEEILLEEAQKRGAQRLSDLGGAEYLAELFAGGPAWQKHPAAKTPKPIIAVVRGRQEFGPRALGHRSLLAFPDSEDMRDRMNRIKFRQWWRPAAPMIADEALEYVFGHKFGSTYMEFAPVVRDEVRQLFPGLSHFDGTARHQSVGREDEPWVHALLLAVGKRTGLAALINTSFNSRGKPITNTVTWHRLSDRPSTAWLVMFCSSLIMVVLFFCFVFLLWEN
jgi:carbamoyltransferase